MDFMYVLMSLIYSLHCPFPLIYIQHVGCVELWPWRRGEPLKDKAVKNSQVKQREEMRHRARGTEM